MKICSAHVVIAVLLTTRLQAGGPRLATNTPPIPGLERAWIDHVEIERWDCGDAAMEFEVESFRWSGEYLVILGSDGRTPVNYDASHSSAESERTWQLNSLARLSHNGVVFGYRILLSYFNPTISADRLAGTSTGNAHQGVIGGRIGMELYLSWVDTSGDGNFSLNSFSLFPARLPDWVCQREGRQVCPCP